MSLSAITSWVSSVIGKRTATSTPALAISSTTTPISTTSKLVLTTSCIISLGLITYYLSTTRRQSRKKSSKTKSIDGKKIQLFPDNPTTIDTEIVREIITSILSRRHHQRDVSLHSIYTSVLPITEADFVAETGLPFFQDLVDAYAGYIRLSKRTRSTLVLESLPSSCAATFAPADLLTQPALFYEWKGLEALFQDERERRPSLMLHLHALLDFEKEMGTPSLRHSDSGYDLNSAMPFSSSAAATYTDKQVEEIIEDVGKLRYKWYKTFLDTFGLQHRVEDTPGKLIIFELPNFYA